MSVECLGEGLRRGQLLLYRRCEQPARRTGRAECRGRTYQGVRQQFHTAARHDLGGRGDTMEVEPHRDWAAGSEPGPRRCEYVHGLTLPAAKPANLCDRECGEHRTWASADPGDPAPLGGAEWPVVHDDR